MRFLNDSRMKKYLSLLAVLLLFSPLAAHAEDKFAAQLESSTDTTVTLHTTRALQGTEVFNASCSPYTGKEESDGFTTSSSIVVTHLTAGTQYTCRMYVYPSSQGGLVQAMSEDVVFTAGASATVTAPVATPIVTTAPANKKPNLSDVQYEVTGRSGGKTTITFTVTGSDPENDPYQLHYVVCKYEGLMCSNAMNGAAEVWTTDHSFTWTAKEAGRYELQAIVRDGFHAGADDPFGDDGIDYEFSVYGSPTVVATAPKPAFFEDKVEASASINPFKDMNSATLAGKAAAELYRRLVIGGYADGTFKPAGNVNRAEAAKFLLLTRFGSVSESNATSTFSDVKAGQWYTKFVITAAQKGIIAGYADNTFRPASTVNTAEFLKMFARTFDLQENLPYSYADVTADAWYARYAGIATKYNLFPNRSTNLLPASMMTREDVAVAIYQYLANR